MSTMQKNGKRAKYSSDISQNGWNKLKKVLFNRPRDGKLGGRPPADLREVMDAIFYVILAVWVCAASISEKPERWNCYNTSKKCAVYEGYAAESNWFE